MDSELDTNSFEIEPAEDDSGAEDLHDFPPEQTVNRLIEYSVRMGASDVFFNCSESEMNVSVRHLGVMKQIALLPLDAGLRCMQHIRAAAGMRFHEKRLPQDARWLRQMPGGRVIDMRLNTMPTIYGESLAIRLLERDSKLGRLDALGLVGPQLDLLISMLHSPSGLILVTGPTGAGKTTTLYASLAYLNDGRRKIHTIEDPVEYTVPGIHQSQVDDAHGADYPQLLRSILRQGPDVIMIGEVRDRVAAETAVRAANSGQLVFATLHAPVAANAIQSLISLGVSAYFVCTSLLGVIGQRLMRTLDPATRVKMDLTDAPRTFEEVRPWLGPDEGKVIYAAASDQNGAEGYAGRTGVFELLLPTPNVRRMIRDGQPSSAVAQKAIDEGMLDFRRAALIKVAKGLTSFDEMLRVVPTGDLWIDE